MSDCQISGTPCYKVDQGRVVIQIARAGDKAVQIMVLRLLVDVLILLISAPLRSSKHREIEVIRPSAVFVNSPPGIELIEQGLCQLGI